MLIHTQQVQAAMPAALSVGLYHPEDPMRLGRSATDRDAVWRLGQTTQVHHSTDSYDFAEKLHPPKINFLLLRNSFYLAIEPFRN